MSAQDRAIQKLARELAGMKREVHSWRGPQADYTSIENGGNFTFKDGDGNVTGIIGGQDDGSTTVRHVDGPVPPIPSGLSAHVDGPIIQVSWDGTLEDADSATFDWSHLEVIAVGPNSENLRGTISDVTGASTNLAATSSGEWTVVARSVSRAEKRSLDGDAGTVDVKLVDIDGAIEAVQDSANGKNQVTYSEYPPTAADPGIFDDTWFVGQVGRPEDIIEATNLAVNPSFVSMRNQIGAGDMSPSSGTAAIVSADWSLSGDTAVKITPTASNNTTVIDGMLRDNPATAAQAGRTVTLSANLHLETPQTGTLWYNARRIVVRASVGGVLDSNYAQSSTPPNVAGDHRVSVTFTLPENIDFWYFMLVNGSSETPVFWDSMMIQDDSQASPYFDGDTPDGATEDESHYRWVGTPHASTSEKYIPALTIGESDAWNITEQYRHDGTSWVRVELSHKVFSTVDLGKATVGELDGIRIAAQTIRGAQLSGDAIDGKVITGGAYRTTGGSGSWSDDGLFIAQPDGTSMVRFPTDGSPLSLTASDVQIDRATVTDLDLSYGAVRSGGELTLSSGVTAPVSPPELTTGWRKACTLAQPNEGYYGAHAWVGLAYWAEGDGHWVRAVNAFTVERDPYDAFEIYDSATGELQARRQIDINPSQGITVMGDTVYALGQGHGSGSNRERYYIDGYNLNTGARVTRWLLDSFEGITNKLAITTHNGELLVAGINTTPNFYMFRYNPTTGARLQTYGPVLWDLKYTYDVQGAHFDGTDLYVSHQQATRVYTVSGGALTRKTDSANASGWAGWYNPNKNGAGYVWRVTTPYVVDGVGDVYSGSTIASDTSVEVCFTWFDGVNETTPSPSATVNLSARHSYTMSFPVRAGLQKRIYIRSGSGLWFRTVAPPELTVASLSLIPGGSSDLPTTNTFPTATPATLKSTNDKFEVKGDGSGHWGNFKVNANGAMSGLVVSAEVLVTPSAANTPTKFTVTLPPGRFAKPPIVWVQLSTSIPHQVQVGCYQPDTPDTFDLYLVRYNTTPTGVTWFAMDRE